MIIHEPIMGKYFIDAEYKNVILFEYSDKMKLDRKTKKLYNKKIVHGNFGEDLAGTILCMVKMMIRDKYSKTRMITLKNYIKDLETLNNKIKETINGSHI